MVTLIESGRFDRHLRRMRGIYAKRRDALIAALAQHAPRVKLQGLAAGIHAVAVLPEHLDEQEIPAKGRERSIGLYPMSRYRSDADPRPPKIVLGFGNLTEPALTVSSTTTKSKARRGSGAASSIRLGGVNAVAGGLVAPAVFPLNLQLFADAQRGLRSDVAALRCWKNRGKRPRLEL